MNDDEFECAMCHERFIKGRTDEEAFSEAREFWPDEDTPMDVICHDCWHKIHPLRN